MSVSHSEAAEPAGAMDLDWEALRWRELEWSDMPKAMYEDLISCLTLRIEPCAV